MQRLLLPTRGRRGHPGEAAPADDVLPREYV
ncbi:hypothetical protein STAFG_7351 [Streptomyces afghaniensis 772]|uniref:Uncharacterized protein n=1 Tax=Streptomyces afghaniensis 772 TaxID=1283301 RepID=S4MGF8_9ACTN|nr:hypothetical protein STAFG_7351 [Streptomyces afghaniensis 772]